MRSPWSYLILLATGLAIGSAGSEAVELTLYGESLCPFCKNWILEEAVPLFQQGFDEYIHLRYVAWGNAHAREGEAPACQHGPLECRGNDYINCVQAHYPDARTWFPYVACLARQRDARGFQKALEGCTKGTELDAALLTACANSSEGPELAAAARRETDGLRPPHSGVPWPTINGVAQGGGSLRSYLCAAIPAGSPRPEVCFGPGPERESVWQAWRGRVAASLRAIRGRRWVAA